MARKTIEALATPGWDIYALALSDDPHAAYRQLRETDPVHDAGGGVYFLTRWEHVEAALRDPSLRAGSGVAESFGAKPGDLIHDVMSQWLMSLDGEAHARARGLVSRPFTPRRVEALQPMIADTAERMAASVAARARVEGGVDLVAALAFALPSEVIRHLFHFPQALWQERVLPAVRASADARAAGGAIEALARVFGDALQDPASLPEEGLLALLRQPDPEGDQLSNAEVVANCVLLVTAAIDTTAGLIANAALCLLRDRQAWQRLREQPEEIPAAITETLRFEPSAFSASRSATGPLTIGGRAIPAGSQLLLSLAAANRDPARFPEPDRFDPSRDGTGVLTFGGGRHVCLGVALARAEARAALDALLHHTPLLRLAGEDVTWRRDNPTIRAPRELCVRSDA